MESRGWLLCGIGEVPFAKKSVMELAAQGSYDDSNNRGLLGSLVGSRRDAPLSRRLRHGAEQEGIYQRRRLGHRHQPYRNTATALLGSTKELRYQASNGRMRSLRGWARRCATAARSRRWRWRR